MARVGTSGAYYPFQELQAILEKQKAHPMRTATPRDPPKSNQNEKGLILHRRRVENQENTTKKMYPEMVLKHGYTWQDMIARTNEEKVIALKLNVSQLRLNHPKSVRTVLPSENPEKEPHVTRKFTIPEQQNRCKRATPNLLTGEGISELDHRVRNKSNWKIGLINKYQNNQDVWGDTTNDLVNRLKEEVNYQPEKDFRPEEAWIGAGMQKKLDLMAEQCKLHRDNMANNPITGIREDENRISKRKTVDLSERTAKSDILNLGPADPKNTRPFTPGRKSFVGAQQPENTASRVLAVNTSSNQNQQPREPRTPQRGSAAYPRESQRSLTPSRLSSRVNLVEQTPPRKFRNDGPDDNGRSAAQAIRQNANQGSRSRTPGLPRAAREQFAKSLVISSSHNDHRVPLSPAPVWKAGGPGASERSLTPASRNRNRLEYNKQIVA